MARRAFRSSRSGAVHNKEWTFSCLDATNFDLAVANLIAFSIFTADEAETVLRTRGEIMVMLDATAVNEDATIAVGLAVVSTRAVAAGTASLPRPAIDGAYPWLWHGVAIVSSGQEAAIVPDFLAVRLLVDSKAMRKVKESEAIVAVFEICDSQDQGGSVRVFGGFRVLTGD